MSDFSGLLDDLYGDDDDENKKQSGDAAPPTRLRQLKLRSQRRKCPRTTR